MTVTSRVELPGLTSDQHEMALESFYAAADQFLDHSKFGSQTWRDLYNEERKTTSGGVFDFIAERDRQRQGRTGLKGKKGVMYVSLDGGSGGESCPSLADSAAVSLSQMAFLAMTVSIFSVVANIANNLNNNNNNQNDNNLNYVHQQVDSQRKMTETKCSPV